ncbi:hypothetical protein GCM10012275_50700 [Longimycelium tulufanense]|uniref:Uncharacterized protein n=1 Tax=Longimycelium tulufanense TaxID=907463 RepID=A0A8J3CG52_9PSEU|nr:hypothetical protein [Longimycelium tulufanense]GGM73853.1 hypothetical protein GCM10012275_50700 [Longimycelium tulufanense]
MGRLADLVAGADIRYELGGQEAHPWVGRYAPDMVLQTPTGTVRLAELTRPWTPEATARGQVATC